MSTYLGLVLSLVGCSDVEYVLRSKTAMAILFRQLSSLFIKPNNIYILIFTFSESLRGVAKVWPLDFRVDFAKVSALSFAVTLKFSVYSSTSVVKLSAFDFLSSLWYLELADASRLGLLPSLTSSELS